MKKLFILCLSFLSCSLFVQQDYEWIIKPKYYNVRWVVEKSNGTVFVQPEKNGKWTFINKDGNNITDTKFG